MRNTTSPVTYSLLLPRGFGGPTTVPQAPPAAARSAPGPATYDAALAHLRAQGMPEAVLRELRAVTVGGRRFRRGLPGWEPVHLTLAPRVRLAGGRPVRRRRWTTIQQTS